MCHRSFLHGTFATNYDYKDTRNKKSRQSRRLTEEKRNPQLSSPSINYTQPIVRRPPTFRGDPIVALLHAVCLLCLLVCRGPHHSIGFLLCLLLAPYLFRLVLDSLDARANGILVSEVSSLQGGKGSLLGDGFQVVVEFVDERGSGRNVELGNLALVDSVQVLDEGPEGVSVGGNDDRSAVRQLGGDGFLPVGNDALEGGGEGLGEFLGPVLEVGVALVVGGVVLGGLVDGGWGNIVAASPDEYLVLSELVDGLLLVESLESTVVSFVDLPGLGDGDPHAVGLFEDVPEGSDGTLLHGGKGDVGLDSGLADELSSLGGLDVSGVTERTIVPSGELVSEVPGRFSVSDEDQGGLVGLLGGGVAATEGGTGGQERA
mmetsp:Transcript_7598/g.22264  ORF Transcript_7598/g.22264 Transcript_7598/m.22264 type:complete len:374 (-) Transcript_7598:147-1268(-)